MLDDRSATLALPDGTRIAYRTEGQGPLMVLYNGLTTTSTFWKHLAPRWAARHTVLTWDLPGHGGSSPARTPRTAEILYQPSIVAMLMDRLGAHTATHVGFSLGCQVMLETYKQLPTRADALVALFGGAGNVLSSTSLPVSGPALHALIASTPPALFAPTVRTLARMSHWRGGHALARAFGLFGTGASYADLSEVTAHMCAVDPETLRVMAQSAENHSAADVLPRLAVPLLIMAGDRDPFAPPEKVAVPMHRKAPRSELVRLREGTHTALLDVPDTIAQTVDDFLARTRR